jgi:hypothetical protein
MNEIEEWFLNEFGYLGFSLTPTLYDPQTFLPIKKVIFMNMNTNIDLKPGQPTHLLMAKMLKFLRKINKDKDFRPIKKINKFKL